MSLDGRNILITGATSGAGRHLAGELIKLGARPILVGRCQEKLSLTCKTIGISEADTIPIDFETVSFDDIVFKVKNFFGSGRLCHGVFHAAGVVSLKPLKTMKYMDLGQQINVTLSPFLAILKWAGQAKGLDRNASIVAMSSVSASKGAAGLGAYSAAKASIEALVRVAAVELVSKGIRVNAIQAGAFASPMHNTILRKSPRFSAKEYEGKHPMGVGSLEDITSAAIYLLSDESKWITGTSLRVDGGFLT